MASIGYMASLLIGASLGLMGGGGSILTVPVLVYLFRHSVSTATGESLFLVGATAAIGAWLLARRGLVDARITFLFFLPSFVMVWLTRSLLLPAIPAQVGPISRDTLLLIFFAALMLATAFSMFRGREGEPDAIPASYGKAILPALLVGIATGLLGAGGGFLIVPALTLAIRLPMKRAVGTSLAIIAVNSLFGFFTDSNVRQEANWPFLLTLTALAGLGVGIGTLFSRRIPGEKLRPAFGIFLLVMGTYMVVREIFLPR